MNLTLKRGVTSKVIRFFVGNSSVTTGAGLTGLVFNTAGLQAYYAAEGSTSATAITLVTNAFLGVWASGGFTVVDATNMPGWYELGVPNAALATGQYVVITLLGATNMQQTSIVIQLDAVDAQDAVAFGLSNFATLATATNLATLNTTVNTINTHTTNLATGYTDTVALYNRLVPPTPVGPVAAFSSAVVNTDGLTATLTFSAAITWTLLYSNSFIVVANGQNIPVTSFASLTTTTVKLFLGNTILTGRTVTIQYTGTQITDTATTPASIAGATVTATNNSTATTGNIS